MKRSLLIAIVIGLTSFMSLAQTPYRVVFDITSGDSLTQKSVVRFLDEISKSNPEAKLEVVYYGKSLDMIVKDRSKFAKQLHDLTAADKNISLKVCAVAMKNNNIEESMLLPEVTIVPDGIYEIISKQAEGWGYIKAAR